MSSKDGVIHKILVVDDQVENLNVIVKIVSQADSNYDVLLALNGKSALEIAQIEIPDLVITDWEMPEMNGIELIEAMKKDPKLEDIPIIMCTGIMTKSENLEAALDAGAVDYIRKPVDSIELTARLQSMLTLAHSVKQIKEQVNQLAEQKEAIALEQEKSEKLLLNILPKDTAEELKEKGKVVPTLVDNVTVLFADIIGFTLLAEQMNARELISELDTCFKAFDEIMQKHGVEKIKTIGDAYMAAAGLHNPTSSVHRDVVSAALDMQEFIAQRKAQNSGNGKPVFEIRVGIHTGSVIAGVVGVNKFQYDVWGDTVNTADRLQASSEVGKVNISQATYDHLKTEGVFSFESRGKQDTKHKGMLEMYFVNRN